MKRILGLVLCLMLLGAASAQSYVVTHYDLETYGRHDILLSEDGTPLTPRDEYLFCAPLIEGDVSPDGQIYQVGKVDSSLVPEDYDPYGEDEWLDVTVAALMDSRGQLLTGFDYASFSYDAASGSLVFSLPDGRVGVMDTAGNILLAPEYAAVAPNGQGGYIAEAIDGALDDGYDACYPIVYLECEAASRPASGSSVFNLIPAAGNTPAEPVRHDTGLSAKRWSFRSFSDGLLLVSDVPEREGRSVYLDGEGRQVFPYSYAGAQDFSHGCAVVDDRFDNSTGVIDTLGNVLIPLKYNYISVISGEDHNTYIGHNDEGFDVYDGRDFHIIMRDRSGDSASLWTMDYGTFYIDSGRYLQIYDADGALLMETDAGDFLDSWYASSDARPERMILSSGEWPNQEYRLIDYSGRIHGDAFQTLNASLWKEGHGRYVFSAYTVSYNAEYDYWETDWAHQRFGVCDEEGSILLEARYNDVKVLDLDRFWVRQGARSGMIDAQGHWYYSISDYESLMD